MENAQMSTVVEFPRTSKPETPPPSSEVAAVDHDGSAFLQLCAPMHFLEGMPFVDPRPPIESRRRWNCWNDVPTDSGCDDYQRGRRYGRLVLDAMLDRADTYNDHKLALSICAIDLEHIIESMIRDGVARSSKGGKHSRTPVTSAMRGFLTELARHIAGIRDGT
jgi:hypothetical protein